MTRSMTALAVCAALHAPAGAEERRAAPVYTNEDLARLAPFRAQTGVASQPASRPNLGPPQPSPAGRGEAYWRREASQHLERVRALRARIEDLRRRIEEQRARRPAPRGRSQRSSASGRTTSASAVVGLERRLHALELELREREASFDDRARREGALPGWLR